MAIRHEVRRPRRAISNPDPRAARAIALAVVDRLCARGRNALCAQSLARRGEQRGGIAVEQRESIHELRSYTPLFLGAFQSQQPRVESLSCELLALGTRRIAAPQEETQPRAGPDGIRSRLSNVHQLQNLVRFVEEHGARGEE